MDLIDRYLQAVKFWLPKQQKQDIIAELWEDIHSEIEGREAELGRPLNEAEVEALLKQRGRPVLVANRYLPQRHLIGPVLFPIYLFVLKIVALCYLTPWILVSIGLMVYGSVDQVGQTGHSVGASIASLWGSLCTAAFVAAGVVTVVFAVLERVQAKSRLFENWDPRKLPPVRTPNQIPRSTSVVELVVNVIAFAWWAQNMASPIVLNHPAVRITLAPVWSYFFWGTLAMTLTNAVFAAVNLARPYATRFRAALRLFNDFAGSVLFCWLLKADVLVGFTMANVSPQKALEVTNALNWWMEKMFPGAIIAGVVIVAVDVYRLVRVNPAGMRAARQATTVVAALLLLAIGAGLPAAQPMLNSATTLQSLAR
jgi:hypothetical protein